jgi:phosphopantothenoylcysteine decarboxylase/phosphopantothenate--cysteine ligase
MATTTCNLLLATYLSAKCPVYFAPRNGFRYVQASLYNSYFKALYEFGNTIIPAESGELASGLSGEGTNGRTFNYS